MDMLDVVIWLDKYNSKEETWPDGLTTIEMVDQAALLMGQMKMLIEEQNLYREKLSSIGHARRDHKEALQKINEHYDSLIAELKGD